MSERAAGILMPISSLPSEYGIGCFSKSAYEFVDWLKKAGQSYWQILPLGPTSYGDSPYQSFSTFAGNPYFISLEELIKEGVLTKKECESVDFGTDEAGVDYAKLYLLLIFPAYPPSPPLIVSFSQIPIGPNRNSLASISILYPIFFKFPAGVIFFNKHHF